MTNNEVLRAVKKRDVAAIRSAVEAGFPIGDVRDSLGRSPVLLAVTSLFFDFEFVVFLLDQGATAWKADNAGLTPLHAAMVVNSVELVKLLLEHSHPVDCMDEHGNTPLLQATSSGWTELDIFRILLEYGADPLAKNIYGNSPMHIATITENETLQAMFTAALESR